ncbi:MAG: MSMEG_0570 family nitrogen starvation response protein [Cyanobacteria bacterium P01_H01_bin.26]
MPEIRFHIQWPDGQQESCYSPSLIVKDYFQIGESYTITDFLQRSRTSLGIASERVKAKYGFPCGLALGQLQKIEDIAQQYLNQPDGRVTILRFE